MSSYDNVDVRPIRHSFSEFWLPILCCLPALIPFITNDPFGLIVWGLFLIELCIFSPRIANITYYLLLSFFSISGIWKINPPITFPLLGDITVNGFLAVVYLIGAGISLFLNRKRFYAHFIKRVRGGIWFLLFALAAFLVTALAHSDPASIKGVIYYLNPILMFISFSIHFRKNDESILKWILLIVLIMTLFRVPFFILGENRLIVKGGAEFLRLDPDVLSAVDYSCFIVVLLPILFLYLIDLKNLFAKAIVFMLLGIASVFIVLFWARASLGVLFVIVILQLFLGRNLKWGIPLVVIAGILIILTPIRYLILDLNNVNASAITENTFAQRIWILWIPILSLLNPTLLLLGSGVRSVENLIYQLSGIYVPVHNLYLSILYEVGIIPLVFFIFGCVSILTDWVKKYRSNFNQINFIRKWVALILPLVSYLVIALTSTVSLSLFFSQCVIFLTIGQFMLKKNLGE
jgi:hypothetical protein